VADPDRTFRVALTGGIASGKSAVADAFSALGVAVLDTDQIARDVVAPGTAGLAAIVDQFGPEALDSNGQLDRRRMRELVFSNPERRRKLEAITHPAIRAELARRSQAANGSYQIHAIPLFVEGGGKGNYDRVLVVDCPEAKQIERVMIRDKVDASQAKQTLAAQASRDQRLAAAHDVITNDGSLEQLRQQVMKIHQRYLQLAAEKAAS
jgi:dephospho-CoA kinase